MMALLQNGHIGTWSEILSWEFEETVVVKWPPHQLHPSVLFMAITSEASAELTAFETTFLALRI